MMQWLRSWPWVAGVSAAALLAATFPMPREMSPSIATVVVSGLGPVPVVRPGTAPRALVVWFVTDGVPSHEDRAAALRVSARNATVVVLVPPDPVIRAEDAGPDGCVDLPKAARRVATAIGSLGLVPDGTPWIPAGGGAAAIWPLMTAVSGVAGHAAALSVGFEPAVVAPVPVCGAASGGAAGLWTLSPPVGPVTPWTVVWNDAPNGAADDFVRAVDGARPIIDPYGTPVARMLESHLHDLLTQVTSGPFHGDDVPVVEVSAGRPGSDLVIVYSGDGGWRDLDRDLAGRLAVAGYAVVGVDSLRYFWRGRTPETVAADLVAMLDRYTAAWKTRRVWLVGYSFGADVLPATIRLLPLRHMERVALIALLNLAPDARFEIDLGEVAGLWRSGQRPVGPDLAVLPAERVLCVTGAEEAERSGCGRPGAVPWKVIVLPGGHHFDGDYGRLVGILVVAAGLSSGS